MPVVERNSITIPSRSGAMFTPVPDHPELLGMIRPGDTSAYPISHDKGVELYLFEIPEQSGQDLIQVDYVFHRFPNRQQGTVTIPIDAGAAIDAGAGLAGYSVSPSGQYVDHMMHMTALWEFTSSGIVLLVENSQQVLGPWTQLWGDFDMTGQFTGEQIYSGDMQFKIDPFTRTAWSAYGGKSPQSSAFSGPRAPAFFHITHYDDSGTQLFNQFVSPAVELFGSTTNDRDSWVTDIRSHQAYNSIIRNGKWIWPWMSWSFIAPRRTISAFAHIDDSGVSWEVIDDYTASNGATPSPQGFTGISNLPEARWTKGSLVVPRWNLQYSITSDTETHTVNVPMEVIAPNDDIYSYSDLGLDSETKWAQSADHPSQWLKFNTYLGEPTGEYDTAVEYYLILVGSVYGISTEAELEALLIQTIEAPVEEGGLGTPFTSWPDLGFANMEMFLQSQLGGPPPYGGVPTNNVDIEVYDPNQADFLGNTAADILTICNAFLPVSPIELVLKFDDPIDFLTLEYRNNTDVRVLQWISECPPEEEPAPEEPAPPAWINPGPQSIRSYRYE